MTTRGITITTRHRDRGVSFEVRWRENIDGERVCRSRSFSALKPAQDFAAEVAHRLAMVKHGRSIMHDRLKKPGQLTTVIEEYCVHLRALSKPTSAYPGNSRYTLLRGATTCRWTLTTDVGREALATLATVYGQSVRLYAASVDYWKRFLRWAQDRYAIDDTCFAFRARTYAQQPGYAWTDMECARLLDALQRPAAPELCVRARRHGGAWRTKMVAMLDWRSRYVLFPITWLMCHWAPRPLEACLLNVRDYDPVSRTLTIPTAVAKNRCMRSFVVDMRTAVILKRQVEDRLPNAPLFYGTRGRRWDRVILFRQLKRVMGYAHIPGSMYSARHHACTMLCRLLRGDLPRIKAITGHKQVSELNRYLHAIMDGRDAANEWDQRLGTFTHESDLAATQPVASESSSQRDFVEAARMRARAADGFLEQCPPFLDQLRQRAGAGRTDGESESGLCVAR